MFFLFYGTDKIKARGQAHKVLSAGKKKHDQAEFFKLTSENFTENKLDELIMSQGLFYSGSIILADNLCETKEVSEILLKRLKEVKSSPNFFVFLEGELNKKEIEKFEKYAEKVEKFVKPFKKLTKKEELALKGEKIDFFDFANSLGERNKKKLWSLYQEALAEEVNSEEVHAMFFWQVKAMLSALMSKDAKEAGLNPYVYSKAKVYAKNFHTHKNVLASDCEMVLKYLSQQLFDMYHLAHRGKVDFAVALERFILEL